MERPIFFLASLRGTLPSQGRQHPAELRLLNGEPVRQSRVPRRALLKVAAVVVVAVEEVHLPRLDLLRRPVQPPPRPPDGEEEAGPGVEGVQGNHLKVSHCVDWTVLDFRNKILKHLLRTLRDFSPRRQRKRREGLSFSTASRTDAAFLCLARMTLEIEVLFPLLLGASKATWWKNYYMLS